MTDHNPNAGKKLVVLGSGPGGYPAAFLAADAGFDVTLIDKEQKPGGVCLYRGCIPSKTLLHAAKLIHEAREAKSMGLDFGTPTVDVPKLAQHTKRVIAKLTNGLGATAKRRNVKMIQGTGRFSDPHTIVVETADGEQTVGFDYCIVSTGSSAARIPGFPYDSPRVMTSREALLVEDVPESLLVVGGGYIGLELGTVYSALGSEVTVVEALNRILPAADEDLVEQLEKRLRKHTLKDIHVNTKVTQIEALKTKCKVKLLGNGFDNTQVDFDKVLIAVGRRPNSADLGLDNTAIKVDEKGFIEIDDQRRTDEAHIFAIGDVAGEPMLAHKATYEARVAVETLAGEPAAYDPAAIPAVVFTDPELAWCGLTETEARDQGIDHHVARFPWAASGRATTLDRNDGLTKMIIDPHTGRLLGVGICGVHAGELIAEGVLAIETGALAVDVQMTIHAHPTLSETVMETAEMVHGASTHYLPPKKR